MQVQGVQGGQRGLPEAVAPANREDPRRARTETEGDGVKIHVYKDMRGEWRWRIKSRNGRTIGDSGEGYKSRAHARRMAQKVAAGPIAVAAD